MRPRNAKKRQRIAFCGGIGRSLEYTVGLISRWPLELELQGRGLVQYFARLSAGRLILWCYFIWYLVVLDRYFDPNWRIWMTSLGLSGIIGVALLINTTRSGKTRVDLEPWPMFRLFVTPFCVSSFSALVKGKNFWLIFSPHQSDLLVGVALIAGFCGAVLLAKLAQRR
jgi:hypothetical protein